MKYRLGDFVVATIATVGIIGIPLVALGARPQVNIADLKPQPWRDDWKAGYKFQPDLEDWAIPRIKQMACVRAELAVRHALLAKDQITMPTCGIEDTTEMDEDFLNVTTSGIATSGPKKWSFTVKMQHLPHDTTLAGFNILDIAIN